MEPTAGRIYRSPREKSFSPGFPGSRQGNAKSGCVYCDYFNIPGRVAEFHSRRIRLDNMTVGARSMLEESLRNESTMS